MRRSTERILVSHAGTLPRPPEIVQLMSQGASGEAELARKLPAAVADMVAERLVRYAGLVGKENVIAGTDCGLGQRVGHPEIAWAKLQASAEGARIATQQLWGR